MATGTGIIAIAAAQIVGSVGKVIGVDFSAGMLQQVIIRTCAKHGISLFNINEPTGTPEKCQNLLREAGFQDIEVKTQQLGFYRSQEQAREWNGGWFHPRENPLLQVSSDQMEELKAEYRKEIEAIATEQGVWYENMTFFVTGCKV